MPKDNKYARLLINTEDDLRNVCERVCGQEQIPTLEDLQELEASISQFRVARISFQVWEDSKQP